MTDAIRKDVSGGADDAQADNEGTNSAGLNDAERLAQAATENNPRKQKLESIAQRYQRQRAEDLGLEVDDAGDGAIEEPAGADEPVGEVVEKPAAPVDDMPVRKGADGQWYMPLKVNGQEKLVPLAKAQAQIQKHEAADQRLQHASQVLRDAEERAARVAQHEQQLAQRLQPPSSGAATSQDSRATARAFVDKLLDSDPDQAAESLAQLLVSRTPSIDVERLRQEVTTEVLTAADRKEAQRELESAFTRFSEDYSELVSDPDLFNLTDMKTAEIMKEKPYLKPYQVLKEAGDYVRKKFNIPGETVAQEPSGNTRQERKQKLTPIPKGSSQAVKKAPEPAPQTPASYVAKLRASRGQGR